MSLAAILALAMVIDALIGEPEPLWSRLPHPAVLMGKAVGWADGRMNHGKGRLVSGALVLVALVALAWIAGELISQLGWLAEAIAAAILLAQRSLVDHVRAVADALHLSLEDGRRAVAKIVGRDTGEMTDPEVARAAIESAAENLSDGVIAPAFWFLLLGLPGLAAYKMVNTADSMIGYRTPRHEQFGKSAARLDDVLNWLPARITALLLFLTRHRPGGWAIVRRDAGKHRSPNAGWPEAAMAVGLGVALSGPRRYHGAQVDYPFVNETGAHEIGPSEIDAAAASLWRAWGAALGLVILIVVVS
ncbi:adenosylcobinamide-phosphate synthase CbiB [Maritimibacter sp. HL-12]|uniref:adenosylcobinamide-phosphate synthase CbiB n=1 Tax=Maritimibacter sp. HL-12 TaxID=1162418 RepID=UPI000A0EF210|nr:adenosylcobinamide-phosphate synthase CbiB [Maritimibacter sp. HL-12]SMH41376.1 adenosylcobinamide-phosphate synthase [Maritimibacter sp. HL-12]